MPDIFISYAREDIEIAKKIYLDLKAKRFDVWIDFERLLPGQRFEPVIQRAIRESRFAIVLLSERSRSKRGYVQKEQHYIFDVLDEYPDSTVYLIPVRLGPCDLSHDIRLRGLQWVDLYLDYEKGLSSIISSMRSHGNVRKKSPIATASLTPPDSHLSLPKANSQPSASRKSRVKYLVIGGFLVASLSGGYYAYSTFERHTPPKESKTQPSAPHTTPRPNDNAQQGAGTMVHRPPVESKPKFHPNTTADNPYLSIIEGFPKRIASIPATVSVAFHDELGGYATLAIAVDGRELRRESILGPGGEIPVETANGVRRLDVIDWSPEQHKLTLSVR